MRVPPVPVVRKRTRNEPRDIYLICLLTHFNDLLRNIQEKQRQGPLCIPYPKRLPRRSHPRQRPFGNGQRGLRVKQRRGCA